jgi:LPS export ABC transporter protein LptC
MPRVNILIKIIFPLLFSILLICCSGKKSVEATTSDKGGGISDNRIWDMSVNITDEGRLKAKFYGGYVERDNLGNSRYFKNRIDSGLVIVFYEKGVKTGTLESERGNINDLTELFSAWDNVIFRSEKGYVLYTDTLVWNRKEAMIYSDTDVMMVKNGRDTLYGEGFISDDRLESYEIKKPRGNALIEKENVK